MRYDPSYVGKIESGGSRPTGGLREARRRNLHAGAPLSPGWKEYDLSAQRAVRQDHPLDEPVPVQPRPSRRRRRAPRAGLPV